MHGPGQTSSIFRLNMSQEQKIRQMEENSDAECSDGRQPVCYWELAIRFMGNKEEHLYMCPGRLLFKGQDGFRGFSPPSFSHLCSLTLSLHEAEVYINTDEASITYSDWIRVAAFAALHSDGETEERLGHCCYAVPFQLWNTERNNILVCNCSLIIWFMRVHLHDAVTFYI